MSATFSQCGQYRYRLDGEVPPGLFARDGLVLFAMLNPSKAGQLVNGAEVTDPTRTRVAGFTGSWGYTRFAIVNLFARIATDPAELLDLDYETAVGPDNDRSIVIAAAEADLVVCAWGSSYPAQLGDRPGEVLALLREAGSVHHLGLTSSGDPRHPLYLRADTMPTRWEAKPGG